LSFDGQLILTPLRQRRDHDRLDQPAHQVARLGRRFTFAAVKRLSEVAHHAAIVLCDPWVQRYGGGRFLGCQVRFQNRALVLSVDAQRPQLRAALDWVRDGDTFMVTKPDRLARNVTDLLRIVEDLKARNVTVRIMSMGVDTSTATGVLILQVLGAVSQWERSVMLERQRHGIAKAKAEGKYRGRAPTARAKTPEVLRLKAEGQTVAQIAQSVGISRASVYRAFAEAG
jgi:DNA invertase Pin-like site-specific DNA recombinase